MPTSKLHIILLLFLLVPSAVHADDLAQDIARVQQAYSSYDDLAAGFTQTTRVKLLDKTIERRGTLQLKRGGKLRIAYADPKEKRYISNGKILWTDVPGDPGSLQSFDLDDRAVSKEALSFLHCFGNLRKEFRVTRSQAFNAVPKDFAALHLVPRSKRPAFRSLDALFNAKGELVQLVINNLSGNVSDYTFTDISTNTGLPEQLFTPVHE